MRFETLESRLLFSADLPLPIDVGTEDAIHADVDTTQAAVTPIIDLSALSPAGAPPADSAATPNRLPGEHRRELVVVDTRVPEAARLYGLLFGGSVEHQLLVLAAGDDAFDAIGRTLLGSDATFDAVHLIGHGAAGAMQLGATRLDGDSVLAHAEQLSRWQAAFDDDADLLLYGCDVAADASGTAWLTLLAALTGTDVAASDDPTGAAELGGDWSLEFRTGLVTSVLVPDAGEIGSWAHLLAVNQTTAATQSYASVGIDASGKSIIVWQSDGQDGSGWGIYGQRVDVAGAKIGGEFRVSQTTAFDQVDPDVAVAANGDFVVVWTGRGQGGDAPSAGNVYARLFASDGTPRGGEFIVNQTVAGDQSRAAVSFDADANRFMVAWASAGQDGSGSGVYARRYDASGAPTGNEFRVNNTTAGNQTAPDVAGNASGGFMFVWQSPGQSGSDWGVYRRYYSEQGVFKTTDRLVNDYTAGDQDSPAVAANGSDDFLIAWTSNGQDGSGRGIYADYIKNTSVSGGESSGEFRVNTTTAGDQRAPVIGHDDGRNFVVVWTGDGQGGDAPGASGIYGQLLERQGSSVGFLGGEFLVNTYQAGSQQRPAVGMNDSGAYRVVWDGQVPDDASGIDLRVFSNPFGNAAPVVSMASSVVTYTENGAAVPIDSALTVTDDSGLLAGATVSITAGFQMGADSLASVAPAGIGVTFDGATGVLTLSGMASVASYQTALRSVTYHSSSDQPATQSRRITVIVDDGAATGSDARDLSVQAVNDAPVLTGANALVSILEDAASNSGTRVSTLLDGWATDPDGAVVGGIAVTAVDNSNGVWQFSTSASGVWLAFGTPGAASARLLAADPATHVRFVPNLHWHGSVAGGLTFRAWDRTSGTAGGVADTSSHGGSTAYSSATATTGIVVTAVNDAPTGTDAVLVLNEDGSRALTAADFGFADASDAPADTLDGVRIAALPTRGTLRNNGVAVSLGQVVSRADIDAGRLVYAPAANANGSGYASLGFQVRDSGGTANGGVNLDPTSNTLVFDVAAVNDAPVNVMPPTQYTAFDTPLTFGAGSSNAITISDVDAGANPIEVVVTIGNGTFTLAGTAGLVFTLGDGTADATMVFRGTLAAIATAFEGSVFTPTTGYDGTASLVLGAYDLGATGAGPSLSDEDTLLIHVAEADALVVGKDDYTTGEDTPLLGSSVLGNDSDPLLGVLSVTAIDGNAAAIGVPVLLASGALLTMNADGTFLYDPNGAFDAVASGTTSQDSFTYAVSSTSGRVGSGSVTVVIVGANDAPVLTGKNDLVPVVEDANDIAGTLVATLIGGHVTDVDGSEFEGIAVISVDNTNGVWQYRLRDSASWLAFGSPSDASARLLRAEAGTAVRFVPNANWNGTVTGGLGFRAWDASNALLSGDVDSTTLNGGRHAYSATSMSADIVVGPRNDAPDGADLTLVLLEDSVVTLSAADFGFTDAADTPGHALLAVQIVTSRVPGSLRLNDVTVSAGQSVSRADIDAGLLRFSPAANAYGDGYASISFRVRDDGGTADGGLDLDPVTNTITFDVTAVNDAPTLASFPGAVPSGVEDEAIALDFATLLSLSDAADVDGAVTSFVVTTVGSGTLVIGASQDAATPFAAGTNDVVDAARGAWWTPSADAWGPAQAAFTVRARDAAGSVSTGTATVRVNVAAVADRPQASGATTSEDTRTIGGLVIARNAVDFGEVTHFRIDAIEGGELYLADGVTHIRDGDFIAVAQGSAGLVFVPTPDSVANGSFRVYGATAASPAATGTQAATVLVTVVPVNDAPVLAGIRDLPDIEFGNVGDAVAVSALLSGQVSDVDGSSQTGLAVVGVDATHGAWHYTLDGGATWQVLDAASDGDALLLAADAGVAIRFAPASGYLGPASLSVRAWDRTSGVAGSRADIATTGGTSAFSTGIATARVSVVPQQYLPSTSTVSTGATVAADFVQAAPGTAAERALGSKNDDAVLVPKDSLSGSGRSLPAAAEAQTAEPAVTVDAAVPGADRGDAQVAVAAAGGAPSPASSPAATPAVQQLGTLSLPVAAASRLVSPADIERLGQDFVAQPEKSVEAMTGQPLLDALDQVRESVADDATIAARVAAASVAVTGSLSVGYVVWLVRGGVLATSLVSSLPAWLLLDPLPVLSSRAQRHGDHDDESLESMVEDPKNDSPDDDARTDDESRRPTLHRQLASTQ